MPGVASAATSVVIGHVAAGTSTIRVGAGGIMLPNHAPLVIAEQFGTLEALFPGRIELGVAKGPGVTNNAVAEALVGGNKWELTDEAFERKVFELARYLVNAQQPSDGSAGVRARPYGVAPPPLWLLGSGSKSQQLASELASSYACALMFPNGMALGPKLVVDYRRGFAGPRTGARACIALSVVCENSEAEAAAQNRALVAAGMFESNVVGTPEQCAARIEAIAAENGVREVLLANWLEDPAQRIATYRRLARAMSLPASHTTSSDRPALRAVA
jgi:luciferase family oxidoreductase group 1